MKRTVICISERVGFSNQIKVGTTYLMDTDTLYSFDNDWYVDIFTIGGARVGSLNINHFRDK